MRIYIPTKGRANAQKTSEVLRNARLAHYIVTEEPQHLYQLDGTYAMFLRCPEMKLVDKRNWILDHTGKHMLVMMDDDMRFRYRPPDEKFRKATKGEIQNMLLALRHELEETAHAGISDEYMCQSRPPGVSRSGRYNGLLAYNPAFWRGLRQDRWPRFRTFLNHDHDFSLQLHRLGFAPSILRDYTKASKPNAKGGLSLVRKSKDELDAHKKLAELWPDLVTVVPSKSSISGFRIRVNWQRAKAMAERKFK